MASFLHLFHIFFLISTSYFLVTQSKPPQHTAFNPNKLVLPIQKDQATHLFITNIHKRTPLKQVPFVVHLNGQFLWVACEQSYLSSTYHAPLCHSTQCARANTPYCHTCNSTPRPGCHNNTCGLMATNPMTHQAAMAELAQDVLSIQSTKGSKPGPLVRVPRFLFACIAGLGHAPLSLPNQLASHFGFPPKFALCLHSSASNFPNGAIFFGNGPYLMLPGIDISSQLPLTISPEGQYYITLTSIRINNKQNVKWTIIGANSMVQARSGVTCLAFVNGGVRPRSSIIIGSHQLQDNLVQFALAGSRLGFSSSLLFRRTSCSNFNFSATP
ncbi:hypothetical protein CUMW_117130 [Citrus unshiu]|nr:hypothetical protein CUMW_117130 [Citrus unshiu]